MRSLARAGFRLRVLAVVGFVAITCSGVMGLVLLSNERESLSRELEQRGSSLAESIAFRAAPGVAARDAAQLGQVLAWGLHQPGVLELHITGTGGETLARGQARRGTAETSGPGIPFLVPVRDLPRGAARGQVRLVLSTAQMQRETARQTRQAMLLVAALLLGSFACFWPVLRLLTRPARRLIEAADRIAAGDVDRRVQVQGSDELARLGLAFNTMVDGLVRSRADALAAARTRSAFLATMSHELRTPMTGVIGMTDVLLQSGLRPDQQEIARTIRDCGDTLLASIDDVLDFSNLEAGRTDLGIAPFEPAALLETARSNIAAVAAGRGVEVEVAVDPGVPPALVGDATGLARALRHLAANAAKFTREGRIVLRARAEAAGRDEVRVFFEVEDTGIGIPAEQLERIFEPFAQGDDSMHRCYGGMGLGLAIARRRVERMGGRLSVDSAPGHGSRFTVELQLRRAPEPTAAAPAPAVPGPAATALPVLVAEDNPVNQRLACRVLERAGYRPVAVANGREAYEAVLRDPYALVLMDCQMPEMDGFEATRAIRREERRRAGHEAPGPCGGSRMPIVAVTANALPEDRARCLDSGMDDFVAKPFRPEALLEVIGRWTAS